MKSNEIHIYKSRRKKDYDYNLPGAYFITICTKNRECLFGEIKDETVILNQTGDIAKECLIGLPSHHSNVDLGEYVIMPNHVHAILMINEFDNGGTQASLLRGIETNGSTQASLLQETDKVFRGISRRLSKLSVVVGSYKSAVTRKVNREIPNTGFSWQRYYYDHIIRDERGLVNVSDYIRSNPVKWEEDLENIKYLKSLANKEREKRIKNFYMNLSK